MDVNGMIDVMDTAATSTTVEVSPLLPSHWDEVSEIYAAALAMGEATFESEVPVWERWDAAHLAAHRLVALDGARVAGWAALTPVSDRCAYAGVADDSVYVRANERGRGVGRRLLTALLATTDAGDIWTVQAQMFPENVASIALHGGCGFRVVGTRERLGVLRGRWRDVVLMERRRP